MSFRYLVFYSEICRVSRFELNEYSPSTDGRRFKISIRVIDIPYGKDYLQ